MKVGIGICLLGVRISFYSMPSKLILSLLLYVSNLAFASTVEKPKLVVVISIDQFRYDYLTRFQEYFGERGFNLFLKEGANFVNAHYRHSRTSTSPGHAVIMSGTYGNINGIIANKWYDLKEKKEVYSVSDDEFSILGAEKKDGRSPENFIGSTIGDALCLSNNGRSKVVSISRKDRTAILMGGKLATAYWIEDSIYTTSTYYMDSLPDWVQKFNQLNKINNCRGLVWERLLAREEYDKTQGPDDVVGEKEFYGRTFPHKLSGQGYGVNSDGKAMSEEVYFYKAFERSPFESEILVEFAKQAVISERLGQRDGTDILCLGFAANDAVGHVHGPNSHEVMDITVRTDRLLEDFFNFLDNTIGLENCLLTLTADHGVQPLPEVLAGINPNFPIHRIDPLVITEIAEKAMVEAFGRVRRKQDRYFVQVANQIYFDTEILEKKKIKVSKAEKIVKAALESLDEIYAVYTRSQLLAGEVRGEIGQKALLSFNSQRSGHIFVQLKPFVYAREEGTGHGSPWSYDSHVPMLWYGTSVKPGSYYEAVDIADIAPTLSVLLQVEFPVAKQGRILHEMFR